MSLDDFARKLGVDEGDVSKDEDRLARDTSKLSAFEARLGGGPDMRLAMNDAGAPAAGVDPSQPPTLPPSMSDMGGPRLGPIVPSGPSDAAQNMAFGPGAMQVPLSQRLQANLQGPEPAGVPLSQTPQASGMPAQPVSSPVRQPLGFEFGTPDGRHGAPPPPLARPAGPSGPNYGGMVDADNRALLRTYDNERAHSEDLANNESIRHGFSADQQQAEAARQMKEAQDAQQEQAHAQELNAKYLAKTGEINEALATQKIDPHRLYGNVEAGTRAGFIIGGFLGGLGGGPNPFLDSINKNIDRDVAAQQENYERQSKSLANRNTIYGHMVQASGDARLASMQTRNAMLEATKIQLGAQMERMQIPEQQARGQLGIDAIDRAQSTLQKGIHVEAARAAAAGAGAAAAARRAEEDRLWSRSKDVHAMGIQDRETAVKEREQAGKGDKGQEKLDAESHEFNQQMDDLHKSPVLDQLGLGTSALAHFGQRLAPDSARTEQNLEQLNTQAMQGILKTAKDAEGKPNVAMIERYEKRFSISPTDTKEIAQQKLDGIRKVVNALARQQGANAPRPNAPPPSFEPDK